MRFSFKTKNQERKKKAGQRTLLKPKGNSFCDFYFKKNQAAAIKTEKALNQTKEILDWARNMKPQNKTNKPNKKDQTKYFNIKERENWKMSKSRSWCIGRLVKVHWN